MIGFYLTTTGEYSPEQVADISNSIILDDKNKTFKVMNQYVFEFQKLSADYENLTVDSSREGLSIYGAKEMYDDLDTKISTIDSSINTLEERKVVVDTSISDINSSISSIKTDYIPNASIAVEDGVASLDSSGHVPLILMPYVQGSVEDLTTGTSTAPMVWDASVINAYIANVSTYAVDVSSRLDTVNTTLTSRIENVSSYAIEVSVYAENVSLKLDDDVSIINSHFSNVDTSLLHHDSSLYEIYDNLYELTQVWAAAWYDISTHLNTTDSSLNEHIIETTGYGAFADRPTNPQTGQIYFATDKQTAEAANNGIPIWYNGSDWIDALGRTVS